MTPCYRIGGRRQVEAAGGHAGMYGYTRNVANHNTG
jgi:hypothetical protein